MNESSASLMMLVVLMVVFYFLLIRPENKRKKKAQEMRENIKKGDTITTIGGIVGRVVMVDKDTLVIETSEDRVRMEITKWAVSSNETAAAAKKAAEKKAIEDAAKARAAKKAAKGK